MEKRKNTLVVSRNSSLPSIIASPEKQGKGLRFMTMVKPTSLPQGHLEKWNSNKDQNEFSKQFGTKRGSGISEKSFQGKMTLSTSQESLNHIKKTKESFNKKQLSRTSYWMNSSAVPQKKTKVYKEFKDTFWMDRKLKNFQSHDEESAGAKLNSDDFAKSAKLDVQNLEIWNLESKSSLKNFMKGPQHTEERMQKAENEDIEKNLDEEENAPEINTEMMNFISGIDEDESGMENNEKNEQRLFLSSLATAKYIADYKKYIADVVSPVVEKAGAIKKAQKGPESIRNELNKFILNEIVATKLKKELKELHEHNINVKTLMSSSRVNELADRISLIPPANRLAKETIKKFTTFQHLFSTGYSGDDLCMEYLLNTVKKNTKEPVSSLNFVKSYKSYLIQNSVDPQSKVNLPTLENNLIMKYKEILREIDSKKTELSNLIRTNRANTMMIKKQKQHVRSIRLWRFKRK